MKSEYDKLDEVAIPSSIKVNFRDLAGQQFQIQFSSPSLLESMTVLQIKEKLHEVHSFPVSAQRFVFLGRELLDHELAIDCHIENECTIHLILRTNQEVHVQIVGNNNDNSNENDNHNQVTPFSEQELSTFSRSKNAVRFLILFDVFVSAIFSMINFLFIVWFILSMIGWRGVKSYSPGLISIYLLHVPILTGVCIWLMVQDVSGLGIFGVICIIFFILTQISIARDIFCFIQNCSRLTPEQKHYLINNNL